MLSNRKKKILSSIHKELVFITNSKNNTWIFVNEDVYKRLSSIVEINYVKVSDLSCNFGSEFATLIKKNPIREVFQGENFFYKHTFTDDGSLYLEFQRTLQLNGKNIPSVKCAALGFVDDGVILVTETQKNTVQLDKYIEKNSIDEKFVVSFRDFILNLITNKIYHGDLHLGNILYDPEHNNFYLVDALKCKAVKSSLWYNYFCKGDIATVFCFMREKFLFSEIKELLLTCKISKPKIFYEFQVKKEVKDIFKKWEKRKAQVLAGYEKFSRKDGDYLYLSSADNSEISESVIVEGNVSYLLADIFLTLVHIPHQRILGVNLKENKVLLENIEKNNFPNNKIIEEFQKRLEDILHIKTSSDDWCNSNIHPIVFIGYEKIINFDLFKIK